MRAVLRVAAAGVVTTAAMALLLMLPSPGSAQQAAGQPVVVALPDTFPQAFLPGMAQGAPSAVIIREPGQKDLVVLHPQHATPATLAVALSQLRKHRLAVPSPQQGVAMVINGPAPRGKQQPDPELEAGLARLAGSPRTALKKFGPARSIELASANPGQ